MTVSNNKTTYLVSSQVPQFVKDDHDTFVTFLEEYYKFLAEEGEMEYVSKNFTNYLDIDSIQEHIGLVHPELSDYKDYHAFLQKMYDNFIKLIPAKVLADRTLILKHVKDFYRARGSEKSVRFLLRILLGKEIDEDFGFYYPKRDILRASDGKWIVEKSIRIRDIAVNNTSNSTAYTNFVNKTIYGETSNATAIVESTDKYFENGQLITELKLSSSIKTFVQGEKVFCFYTEEGIDKHLSANLFSGIVTTVVLVNGGAGYTEGDYVPVEGGDGSGAQVIVASTTKGRLSGVGVIFGGAGFRVNDSILITEGGGSGAAANVLSIDNSETYHPNTYNVISSIISLETNTPIGNARYSNLVSSIVDPANAWITNSMSSWAFSNCGPIVTCLVVSTGNNYSFLPNTSAQGNTFIKSLGILGRMQIVDGGLNYQVGDKLEFINPSGSYGLGASANVTAVAANGAITQVKFVSVGGDLPGGQGYAGIGSITGFNPALLPTVNIATSTGSGANVIVRTLLGYGEDIRSTTDSIGTILSLKLISGGSGYVSVPTINLANMSTGSGAQAISTIATGTYIYPGRFINDDGHLSSYNFLEDRDYYQNYSYVVRINASLKDYRKTLLSLTHPSGTKLFGQYLLPSESVSVIVNTQISATNTKFYQSTYEIQKSDALLNGVYNVKTLSATYTPEIKGNTSGSIGTYKVRSNISATYTSLGSAIIVNSSKHLLKSGDNVYLQFANATANVTNGYYVIISATPDVFSVTVKGGNTAYVVLPTNTSNLTANTGPGNTNSFITLTQWVSNSNVAIAVGDTVNVGGNLVSVVSVNSTSNTIAVFPGVRGNLIANTVFINKAPYLAFGNVRVYDPTVTVFATTSLIAGDRAYFKFETSDISLANDTYNIISANSSVLRIRHRDIISATSFSGNVSIYTTTLIITSTNHSLSNNDNVFITFNTGDLSNATNGLYVIRDVTQNTFNITTGNSITTIGNATLRTANIIMNVASHGFKTNDSVYIWFTSGNTANETNGFQTVTVLNNDSFSYIPKSIPNTNGTITVYRNYMNVSINRTAHGFTLGQNVAVQFDTGNLANIANGIYRVNSVANSNSYNILHNAITISGNINNLISNSNGIVYVSVI